jgi:L-amino acid N-acyltransferase YncA
MNESASCGLDSDIGFTKCCGMRTLAQKCVVVPVTCSA